MLISDLSKYYPPNALEACWALQRAGYQAVIVGGPVRDLLLGERANDVDLATSATPDQMEDVFRSPENRKRFPNLFAMGKAREHGTIGVVDTEEEHFEITTFRKDVETDGRHAKIEFVSSLDEDLLRRDFTINAMAIEPLLDHDSGVLIDPYGGRQDLEKRIIRAVGDPIARFQEDRLRILRAYRFAARLQCRIERNTRLAMKAEISGILNSQKPIAWERILGEFTKLFEQAQGNGWVSLALKAMDQDGLLDELFPEFARCRGISQGSYHRFTTDKHIRRATDAMRPDPTMRWIMFLHDLGKPDTRAEVEKDGVVKVQFLGHDDLGANIAREITGRLKMSNDLRDRITEGVRMHMALREANRGISDKALRKIKAKLTHLTLDDLLEIRIADKNGSGLEDSRVRDESIESLRDQIAALNAANAAVRVSELELNGRDLITMGFKPGPDFKEILGFLQERVIEEPHLNDAECLRELVLETYGHLRRTKSGRTPPSEERGITLGC